MQAIPQPLFDIYALALPRGHGFGNRPPVGAWESNDKLSCGIVTRDDDSCDFGLLVIRRRVDHVWTITSKECGLASFDEALAKLELLLKDGLPPEPLPQNTAPRLALYNLEKRKPSDIFSLLTQPSYHVAAYLFNQLYLSLPNPDGNWASDCQTANFHTRLWEAQLLASFREQGLLVTQPCPSPDFQIENRLGGSAWVEAVTANPSEPYNHVNSSPSQPPKDRKERLLGSAANRFAKTLGNKIQRGYENLPHVSDKPFMFALADFHAPASMVWSRGALISYLYGMFTEVIEVNGCPVASVESVSHLLGKASFPAGLFCNEEHHWLSGVIFSNACSIAKLNRVGVSAGMLTKGLRYVRVGEFYDREPGSLKGIPFCLDVTSAEYKSLWPQGYEPWAAELEVFHNPYASYPVSHELLPEATHWFEANGEIVCNSYYETSVLYSRTIIQKDTDRMLIINDSRMEE